VSAGSEGLRKRGFVIGKQNAQNIQYHTNGVNQSKEDFCKGKEGSFDCKPDITPVNNANNANESSETVQTALSNNPSNSAAKASRCQKKVNYKTFF
jgi:hypothetical protein